MKNKKSLKRWLAEAGIFENLDLLQERNLLAESNVTSFAAAIEPLVCVAVSEKYKDDIHPIAEYVNDGAKKFFELQKSSTVESLDFRIRTIDYKGQGDRGIARSNSGKEDGFGAQLGTDGIHKELVVSPQPSSGQSADWNRKAFQAVAKRPAAADIGPIMSGFVDKCVAALPDAPAGFKVANVLLAQHGSNAIDVGIVWQKNAESTQKLAEKLEEIKTQIDDLSEEQQKAEMKRRAEFSPDTGTDDDPVNATGIQNIFMGLPQDDFEIQCWFIHLKTAEYGNAFQRMGVVALGNGPGDQWVPKFSGRTAEALFGSSITLIDMSAANAAAMAAYRACKDKAKRSTTYKNPFQNVLKANKSLMEQYMTEWLNKKFGQKNFKMLINWEKPAGKSDKSKDTYTQAETENAIKNAEVTFKEYNLGGRVSGVTIDTTSIRGAKNEYEIEINYGDGSDSETMQIKRDRLDAGNLPTSLFSGGTSYNQREVNIMSAIGDLDFEKFFGPQINMYDSQLDTNNRKNVRDLQLIYNRVKETPNENEYSDVIASSIGDIGIDYGIIRNNVNKGNSQLAEDEIEKAKDFWPDWPHEKAKIGNRKTNLDVPIPVDGGSVGGITFSRGWTTEERNAYKAQNTKELTLQNLFDDGRISKEFLYRFGLMESYGKYSLIERLLIEGSEDEIDAAIAQMAAKQRDLDKIFPGSSNKQLDWKSKRRGSPKTRARRKFGMMRARKAKDLDTYEKLNPTSDTRPEDITHDTGNYTIAGTWTQKGNSIKNRQFTWSELYDWFEDQSAEQINEPVAKTLQSFEKRKVGEIGPQKDQGYIKDNFNRKYSITSRLLK